LEEGEENVAEYAMEEEEVLNFGLKEEGVVGGRDFSGKKNKLHDDIE
jgi:hypothetical protein